MISLENNVVNLKIVSVPQSPRKSACARARARVWVCVLVSMCVCVCVRACVRACVHLVSEEERERWRWNFANSIWEILRSLRFQNTMLSSVLSNKSKLQGLILLWAELNLQISLRPWLFLIWIELSSSEGNRETRDESCLVATVGIVFLGKHAHFLWKIKWWLEYWDTIRIMVQTAPW